MHFLSKPIFGTTLAMAAGVATPAFAAAGDARPSPLAMLVVFAALAAAIAFEVWRDSVHRSRTPVLARIEDRSHRR